MASQLEKIKAIEAQIKAAAANVKVDGDSLISLIPDKYDPAIPNDYEEYCRERERLARHEAAERLEKRRDAERKEREERRRKEDEEREERRQKEDADRDRTRQQGGSAAPAHPGMTAAPNPGIRSEADERDGNVSFAQKYMKAQGWEQGHGLGAKGQGMASALEHQKTGLRTAVIQQSEAPKAMPKQEPAKKAIRVKGRPTRVILLLNMVAPGEVDAELQGEIEEECTKYGPVERTAIYEVKEGSPDPQEAVRIFAKFVRQESAMKALVDLNGRLFGGRRVNASFFPQDKFDKSELAP